MSEARKTPVSNVFELHHGMDKEDEEMRVNAILGKHRASFGECKDVNEGDLSEDEDEDKEEGDLSEEEDEDKEDGDEEENWDEHVKAVVDAVISPGIRHRYKCNLKRLVLFLFERRKKKKNEYKKILHVD